MGKRDVTDWTQKGNQTIKMQDGKGAVDKVRDAAGKAGLLMCAAAVIAVLAKAVRKGGLEEYDEYTKDEPAADKSTEDESTTDNATESDKTK